MGGGYGTSSGMGNWDQYLQNCDWPADKDDVLKCARDNGAPQNVISQIQRRPDKRFNNRSDLSNEMRNQ